MEAEAALHDWATPTSITTEQLDAAVKKLVELDADMEAKKKVYREADEKYETQRSYVLSLLQETGKTKYHVDGVGTVSMAIKTAVKVPKDPSDKRAMIDYFLKLEEGHVYPAYLSVNHNVLNSYINQQLEAEPEFKMPGVSEKTETPELRFRKEK